MWVLFPVLFSVCMLFEKDLLLSPDTIKSVSAACSSINFFIALQWQLRLFFLFWTWFEFHVNETEEMMKRKESTHLLVIY